MAATEVPVSLSEMTEAQLKKYLLSLLREAINEEDAVLIQPNSNQALILRND